MGRFELRQSHKWKRYWLLTGVAVVTLNPPVFAQETSNQAVGLEDIVVTAQKRGVAEKSQDVPLAITAFSGESLERKNASDLSSLTTSIPNVSLESSGTFNGQANFEIRGFGISSSIPSVEPSVGVFIDGVYQGQTVGIITEFFDLGSLEVLRGPQGTLFGRNTTGGAVSITTRRPGEELQLRAKVAIESGLKVSTGISVEGALVPDRLRAKLTAFVSHDDGYFYNKFTRRGFGENTTYFLRPTVVWDVSPDVDQTLIYEHGRVTGDGPAAANSQFVDKFNLNINEDGGTDIRWDRLTSETNAHVAFGEGVITNVAGWSQVKQIASIDVDGLPQPFFASNTYLKQHQFSEELRYAGTFGPVKLTIGGYFFTQDYYYIESRRLNTVSYPLGFGGRVNQDSIGIFGQFQWQITDAFSLIAGGRYSWEKKKAQVATLVTASPRCFIDTLTCDFNFPGAPFADDGENTWSRFSPKIGFQWRMGPNAQFYGSYSEGVRSGGYNIRSSAGGVSPGPYDQELQDAFELGWKTDLFDRRLRFNAAGFYNKIHNLQRDIGVADPVVGSAQVTRNVGTAEIYGGETELTALVTPSLTIGAHAGYLHGKYTTLTADLNGAMPGLGYELALVRLPKWSYGVNAEYRVALKDQSEIAIATDFGHVDRAAAQDNNTAFLSARNIWNGSLSYDLKGSDIKVTLFAKNILDKVTWAQASARSAAQGGGAFLTLNKGRVLGASIDMKF